jgi:hypothetical protein
VNQDTLPDLAPVFAAVEAQMRLNQQAFNQADAVNGDHGDHMLAIFEIAARAAQEKQSASLAEAMDYAAELLFAVPQNGSAQVYGRGLASLAEQCRKYDLSLGELSAYVRDVLAEKSEQTSDAPAPRSGEILKALVAALAGWKTQENGAGKTAGALDLGYMFDLGVAYVGARQRGGTRAEVIADAAAAVSPLNSIPYRRESGRLAILALLQALGEQPLPG